MNRIFARFAVLGLFALCLALSFGAPRNAAAQTSEYTAVPVTAPTLPMPSYQKESNKIAGHQKSNGALPNSTAPHLVTTISAAFADGTPIAMYSTVTVPKYPVAVTFTITVQNAGAAPVSVPSTMAYYIESQYSPEQKPTYQPLPELGLGQAKVFTRKVTFTTPGNVAFYAYADAFNQINEDDSNAEEYIPFSLLSSHVDLGVFNSFVGLTLGSPHVGAGVNPGDTVNAYFSIYNVGAVAPTHDVNVQIASPIIGKTIHLTVPVAQLPTKGNIKFYTVSDASQTPLVFTIPAKAKPGHVAYTVSINQPRTFTEDSYSNNSYKTSINITPLGINLDVSIGMEDSAPFFAGTPTKLYFTVYDEGSQSVNTPFQVQVLMDGKPTGAPITVPSVQAGSQAQYYPQVTVTKSGFHTFSVRVDSSHVIKEYNKHDNTATITKVFFQPGI